MSLVLVCEDGQQSAMGTSPGPKLCRRTRLADLRDSHRAGLGRDTVARSVVECNRDWTLSYLGIVLFVEVLQPAVQNVRAIIWLDSFVVELPLCLRVWHQAVFHDIVPKAVRSLRVLACRFEMSVADLIPEFLQIGIFSRLEMLVKLWLVIAILDPEVNDLSRDLRVCQVKGRC